MHDFLLSVILNLSVLITAITAIVRFKYINSNYYPFLFIIWLGLINELLSMIMVYSIRNNSVNSNVFVLTEYFLILLQFYKWNADNAGKYYLLTCVGLMIWLADNFILNSVTENNSLFRVFYSFVIVLLSINQVNKIIIYEKGTLIKNAIFIICITFLCYYGCKAFVETFNAVHLGFSNSLLLNLYIILYFANVVCNFLYALAILCIPTRQEFTLPY